MLELKREGVIISGGHMSSGGVVSQRIMGNMNPFERLFTGSKASHDKGGEFLDKGGQRVKFISHFSNLE